MTQDKRKNRKKARKEKKSVEKVETEEDRFGVDDHISRLPDLCLLKICTHLTRSEICNLSLLNSRMWSIANEKSLDYIKWPGAALVVVQTKEGYGFYLGFEYSSPDLDNYQYEIIKRRNEFIEQKVRSPAGSELSENHGAPHSWEVPEQYYVTLFELMRKIDVKKLVINGMPIGVFYSKLERALEKHSLKSFDEFDVKGQRITLEGRMSLARIMKRVEEVHLEYSGSLVTEDFLREVIGGKLKTFLMEDGVPADRRLSDFFRPTEAFLQYLLRIDALFVPTMQINVNWIPKLIMSFFDVNPSLSALLYFSLDQPLTEDMLFMNLRRIEHEYVFEDDSTNITIIYITRSADNKKVKIEQDAYQVEGGEVHRVLLDFMKEDGH